MAAQPGDPEAMHLYQLIGAPLLAVVQAEAQAAQTSAEFIQRFGFERNNVENDLLHNAGNTPEVQMGGVKMARFAVQRPDDQGVLRSFEVSIPVLSLFPIPLLQVKDAEFEFAVRVLTRVPLQSTDDQDTQTTHESDKDFLSPKRVELKGLLAPQGSPSERTSEMNINVKIRMQQSDLPAGLTKLLTLLENGATSRPLQLEPQPDGR